MFEAVTISTLFAEPSFILYTEDGPRRYAGTLKFIAEGNVVQAVNLVGAEDYLLSVVSLYPAQEQKAQSIRLRKWLWAQMSRRQMEKRPVLGPELTSTPGVVTWLEHRPRTEEPTEELPVHLHYDVCAEEHCQRYSRRTDKADAAARKAIDETWGKLE